MADGMMSRPPTGGGLRELTPRQQRRQRYLQARGRQFRPSQRVQAQPTEMPQQELTPRQQRRQQYLQRRDARRERAVADYRAQQQAQQAGQQLGGFQPYPLQLSPDQIVMFRDRLGQGIPFNPNVQDMTPNLSQLPAELADGQGYDKMLRLPPGQTQEQAVGAAMQEPMRTPTPEFVNQMPGQLRTGIFTPQGMYRPLPYNATPQQIRERQALIETGGYFDQPLPSQRMR